MTTINQITPMIEERRSKPRVYCSYPAKMRGQLSNGMDYEANAILANISAGGVYLLTKHHVRLGERLSVIVRLAQKKEAKEDVPRLSISGSVIRVEHKADGTRGIAVKLSQHRFL